MNIGLGNHFPFPSQPPPTIRPIPVDTPNPIGNQLPPRNHPGGSYPGGPPNFMHPQHPTPNMPPYRGSQGNILAPRPITPNPIAPPWQPPLAAPIQNPAQGPAGRVGPTSLRGALGGGY